MPTATTTLPFTAARATRSEAGAQGALGLVDAPAPAPAPDVGPFFELGWDHARHGLTPAPQDLAAHGALRHGWQAGRAVFGRRAGTPARHVQQWLALRREAAAHGIGFDTAQLTPAVLRQIDADVCPITREAIPPGEAVVLRLREDAGFAAGGLVALGARAAAAAAGIDARGAAARVRRLDAAEGGATIGFSAAAPQAAGTAARPAPPAAARARLEGLDSSEWARLAVLRSFATPLPHEAAAALPLLVLPPERVRPVNPVQRLQALLTAQLLAPGWAARLRGLAATLPAEQQADLHRFLGALAPRLLEAGRAEGTALRQALEDAWTHPLVNRRWQRLALSWTPGSCEALLQRAARRLGADDRGLQRSLNTGARLAMKAATPSAKSCPRPSSRCTRASSASASA